jgi:hypothetical protein
VSFWLVRWRLIPIARPTGEMVLVWSLGAHGVALVGNLADFSREEFIALAESVALPE